jgi:hypothetical protein
MKSPHAIVRWLFHRLRLDAALLGDLLEERRRGRSALWYGTQVLAAIWLGIWCPIRDHKLLTVRAVATGFAMQLAFVAISKVYIPNLPEFSDAQWITQFVLVLLSSAATGWTVAKTHRSHPLPMTLAFLACFVVWVIYSNLAWLTRLLQALELHRVRPELVMYLMTLFTLIGGVLLGALLASGERKSPAA